MKIMLSPSPSASLLLLLMSSITPSCCLPPAPQTPLPGPEKADPDHVPFPCLILSISLLLTPHSPSSERHLSSPHLQVTTTWARYCDLLYWWHTLESVVCLPLLVCFCVHRLQMSASVCEMSASVSVSTLGKLVLLIWRCKTPMPPSTISSLHVNHSETLFHQSLRIGQVALQLQLQLRGRTFIFSF